MNPAAAAASDRFLTHLTTDGSEWTCRWCQVRCYIPHAHASPSRCPGCGGRQWVIKPVAGTGG